MIHSIVLALAPFAIAAESWSLQTADTALTVRAEADRLVLTDLRPTRHRWIDGESKLRLPDRVFVNGGPREVHWNSKVRLRPMA